MGCMTELGDITACRVSPFTVVTGLSHPPHKNVVSLRSVACFGTKDESILPSLTESEGLLMSEVCESKKRKKI